MSRVVLVIVLIIFSFSGVVLAQQKTSVPSEGAVRYQLWGTPAWHFLLDTWTGKTWRYRPVIKDGEEAWFPIEKVDTQEQAVKIIELQRQAEAQRELRKRQLGPGGAP